MFSSWVHFCGVIYKGEAKIFNKVTVLEWNDIDKVTEEGIYTACCTGIWNRYFNGEEFVKPDAYLYTDNKDLVTVVHF